VRAAFPDLAETRVGAVLVAQPELEALEDLVAQPEQSALVELLALVVRAAAVVVAASAELVALAVAAEPVAAAGQVATAELAEASVSLALPELREPAVGQVSQVQAMAAPEARVELLARAESAELVIRLECRVRTERAEPPACQEQVVIPGLLGSQGLTEPMAWPLESPERKARQPETAQEAVTAPPDRAPLPERRGRQVLPEHRAQTARKAMTAP